MNFYIDVLMQGSLMIGGENVNDAEANAKREMWWLAGMLFDMYYADSETEQAKLGKLMHEKLKELNLMFDHDVEIRESK